jgi:hypothetical protein
MNGVVSVLRLSDRGSFLQSIRYDDAGDCPFGLGDGHGSVHQMSNLRRMRGLLHKLTSDILEE